MDWNQLEGNWKQVRGTAKAKWGRLTDADLTEIEGRREQLEGKIQERYGYTKERVRKERPATGVPAEIRDEPMSAMELAFAMAGAQADLEKEAADAENGDDEE